MSYPDIKRNLVKTSWCESAARRTLDFIAAALLLILLAPIFLVVAIAIKATSSGPVFFKQMRHGKDGIQFNIIKFRTMFEHKESSFVQQASDNDPRITRVGAWLRRTSLDELPQLINVLIGDMSLIGPRPHAISHDEYYSRLIPNYLMRQKVRPGITGLAQCMGLRGETKQIAQMHLRVEADTQYIIQSNPILDIYIIFKTLFTVFGMKNAH